MSYQYTLFGAVDGGRVPALTVTSKPKVAQGAPLVQVQLVRDQPRTYMPRTQVLEPRDAARFIAPYFRDLPTEEFLVISLSTNNTVINYCQISRGGLAASIVEPRAVFQAAILSNAAGIIAVHNHPSGNPEPSRQDIRISRQLVGAGKLIGIPIHDHIIIAESEPLSFTSLAEHGLLTE